MKELFYQSSEIKSHTNLYDYKKISKEQILNKGSL